MMLLSRNFFLLWHGQVISQLGSQAFLIAAAFFTLDVTGSTTVMSAVMIASTVPLVLLAPIGGAVADRYSRRTLVIVTDLLRALALAVLALFIVVDHRYGTRHVAVLLGIAMFNGAMSAFFTPAVQAFIPDLIDRDRLPAANSAVQFSTQASVLIGQSAGGLLYLRWGAAGLLLFDAVSFAYAAFATSCIPRTGESPHQPLDVRSSLRRYRIEITEGVTHLREHAGMVSTLVTFAAVNFFFMPVFVLLPPYVRAALHAGPDWYGFLLASSSGGALAGAFTMATFKGRRFRYATILPVCIGAIAGCVIVLSATSTGGIALAALFTVGFFAAATNVTVITMFQAAPPEVRGRVMSLVVAVSSAAVPLGLALGGLLGDLWPDALRTVYAACGGALALLTVIATRSVSVAERTEAARHGSRPT